MRSLSGWRYNSWRSHRLSSLFIAILWQFIKDHSSFLNKNSPLIFIRIVLHVSLESYNTWTRIHSSRMRTVRSLPYEGSPWTETPWAETTWTEISWTEIPQTEFPRTETPPKQKPPGQRSPRQRTPEQRPPRVLWTHKHLWKHYLRKLRIVVEVILQFYMWNSFQSKVSINLSYCRSTIQIRLVLKKRPTAQYCGARAW